MDQFSSLEGSGDPSPDASGSGISVSAFVNASGQSIGVKFLDASGNPTNIQTLSLSTTLQPVLKRNGAAVSGLQWTYGRAVYSAGASPQAPYSPEATAWLPQSSPSAKYFTFGDGVFIQNGYYWQTGLVPPGPNYSGNPQATVDPGDSITFICDGFLPGTYQLAMTWVPDPSLASNAAVTIQTISNGVLDTAIAAITVNQSVAPTDFTLGGVAWKILQSSTIAWPTTGFQFTLTNPGGKINFDALQITRTSADQSVTIQPGDVVTLDLPYAWATCSAGPVVGPSGTAPSVSDPSFETPSAADYGTYNPTGTAWTFSGAAPGSTGGFPQASSNGSGVAAYGSSFLYRGISYTIPDGTQVGFLQGVSSISQTVSGFTAGSYAIAFRAAPRWANSAPVSFTVSIDGVIVGTFTVPYTDVPIFQSFSTQPFAVTAGSHTIAFSSVGTGSVQDTVLLDLVAIQTATGISGIPVANNVGQSPLGVPNTNQTTTLPLGYNISPDNFSGNPGMLYSNVATRLGFSALSGVVLNTQGYITQANQQHFSDLEVCDPGNTYIHASRFGMHGVPNGKWTVKWDGTDIWSFRALDSKYTVSEDLSYQILGQSTGNCRVFNVQSNPSQAYSPQIYMTLTSAQTVPDANGNYAYHTSNLSIVPPNPSDPTGMTPWLSGVPKWYPATMGWIAGAKILRNMDWLNTNSNVTGTYADLRVPGQLNTTCRSINATIATISNVTGTPYIAQQKYVSFQVSFTAPHGLFESAFVTLIPAQQLNFTDSTNVPAGYGINGFVHVIDALTIEFMYFEKGATGTPITLTGSTTGGSVLFGSYTGSPWLDFIDLCSTNGSNMHCNIPIGCDDDCITRMAQDCASRLTHGLKIDLEWGNEHWNYFFPVWHWLLSKSYAMTGSFGYGPTPAYVAGAAHAHSVFIAAWVAAGRSASDVIRVMGSQGAYSGVTANIISAAASQGVTFDKIDVAIYLHNTGSYGAEVTFQQIFDGLTTGQILDYFDYNLRYGKWERYVTDHAAVLQAAGLTNVKIGLYEGGMEAIMPGDTVVNGFERSYDAILHPRMFAQQFYFQQLLQDTAHADSVSIYYMLGGGGITSNNLIQSYPFLWSTFTGYNQKPGTGNPSIDSVNVSSPLAFNQVKSEVGGAIELWNALRSGPITATSAHASRQQRTTGRKAARYHGI